MIGGVACPKSAVGPRNPAAHPCCSLCDVSRLHQPELTCYFSLPAISIEMNWEFVALYWGGSGNYFKKFRDVINLCIVGKPRNLLILITREQGHQLYSKQQIRLLKAPKIICDTKVGCRFHCHHHWALSFIVVKTESVERLWRQFHEKL